MPIYESICTKCGREHEYTSSVADRAKTPKCCGKKTVREIRSAVEIGALSWQNTKACMVAGKYIDSGSAYKRLMKQGGYIPEHEARVEAKKARQYAKEKQKKKLGKAIEKAMKGHA